MALGIVEPLPTFEPAQGCRYSDRLCAQDRSTGYIHSLQLWETLAFPRAESISERWSRSLATNTVVLEASSHQHLAIENIAAINEDGAIHALCHIGVVEILKLLPVGD